jgi:predicted GTPase
MAYSDFLNENLAVQCSDLAGEVNKVYQHLPWAKKIAVVSRLKRQIHQLSEDVQKAQDSQSKVITQKHLLAAVSLIHECVPLMDLCLKKALLSPELNERWIKRLNSIGKQLSEWQKAG